MTIFSPPPVEGQVADPKGKFQSWWIRWINQVQALLRNLRLYPESFYVVPIDGFVQITPADVGNLVLNPSGTLSNGTVYLPTNPIDNQVFAVSSTKTITAFSVATSDGTSISNVPTTMSAGSGYIFRFLVASNTWYLVSASGSITNNTNNTTIINNSIPNDAPLTIAQQMFHRHIPAPLPLVVNDSALTIAQQSLQRHSPPLPPLTVDDSALTIAQQSLQQHALAPGPGPSDSANILATQIFGA